MQFTLRPYQEAAIEAAYEFLAVKKQSGGLIVLPTGSGKSLVIAGIIRKLNAKTLILQPSKEILVQNFQKYRTYGFYASIFSASLGRKEMSKTVFATIGSIVKRPALFHDFEYVIIDECFPAGTLIDGKPIETLRPGDLVKSFNHESKSIELKKVVRLFKNEQKGHLLLIKYAGGSFICTENHPIFTYEKGYLPAYELALNPEKYTLLKINGKTESTSYLHSMRKEFLSQTDRSRSEILQSRMQNEIQGRSNSENSNQLLQLSEGTYNRRQKKNIIQQNRSSILFNQMLRSNSKGVAQKSSSKKSFFTGIEIGQFEKNEGTKSNVDARCKGENDQINAGQDISIQRRQRRIYEASNDFAFGHSLSNGIRNSYRTCKAFIQICSSLLQSGFSYSGKENSDRGGRPESQTQEMDLSRQAQDGNFKRIRLESIEIYQSGSGGECKSLREKNYVYNIEVEDNHNYFAENVLVHNCHLTNPKGGQYADFLKAVPHFNILGLTATPYRLSSDTFGGSILKFITRTNPRIFRKVVYYVQNKTLFDAGYLAPIKYYEMGVFDRNKIKKNTTGNDFDEKALRRYYDNINLGGTIVVAVRRLTEIRRNILVFVRYVKEAEYLAKAIPGAEMVTGDMPDEKRDNILRRFKAGSLQTLINIGVVAIGFDKPDLETVVLGRETMSLALFYQWIGRGIRPHEDKKECWVVDICGNFKTFGKIEDLTLEDTGNEKWVITSQGRALTNEYFGEVYVPRTIKL